GVPSAEAIRRVKEAGAKLICFAPALVLAKRLIKLGADALVIEGHEAGGHVGPVSTAVLAQEILPAIRDVPVFVAGGIGRGDAVVSFLELGAAGVQMGTRFVCASECIAHPKFKQALIRASARDATISVQLDKRFPVIPVRALSNQGTEAFLEKQREVIAKVDRGELKMDAAQLEIEHFWAGALRRAVIDGDVERGSVMAGQSVGLVDREQPVAEIMRELISQAGSALESCAA
ncbi:MAG: 2-nitropropane dioxygenase, partial [Alphaproteobacteria bacterium]|nr:2-nitropropane dioxygenase [Alphaproteobacteria bacterium]